MIISEWVTAGKAECFYPNLVFGIPEPARRYLLHAIAPGTPLASSVEMEMEGRIRLSRSAGWMPLRAHQRMSAARGFVWKASAGRLLRIVGEDHYLDGKGGMEWKLWNWIPVVQTSSGNVRRSARGRFIGEAATWLPTLLLPLYGTTWRRVNDRVAEATVEIDGPPFPLLLTISAEGSLQKVVFSRWGNVDTEGGRWMEIPFGVTFSDNQDFGGYTLPNKVTASWWIDSDRQFDFFEAIVTSAKFNTNSLQI